MRQVIRLAVALTVAIGLGAAPSTAFAQAVSGTLLGNITDTTGSAVPGATITATEVETNVSRTAVSNEAGYYIFTSMVNGSSASRSAAGATRSSAWMPST